MTWLISSYLPSIIAVHGLNGDPANTWKHPANNYFWLQDSLPLDVTGARVLNYGYNADVVFGNTTADVWDHAKSLLGSLIDERETKDVRLIPHSLFAIWRSTPKVLNAKPLRCPAQFANYRDRTPKNSQKHDQVPNIRTPSFKTPPM